MTLKNKAQPWHRQADESSEQFELFDLFLRERNVTEVARQYFLGKDDKAVEIGRIYIQRIKREKKWEARCAAYDRWVSQQKDSAVSELISQEITLIKKQRITLLRRVMKVADQAIKQIETQDEKPKLYEADMVAQIATRIDALWSKFEDRNVATASAAKPFESEMQGAQERLLEFVAKAEQKLEKQKDKEILQ